MKTEIDLRTNIAVIEGTPEEIARTLNQITGGKDLNIEKTNSKQPAKLPARLFDTVEDTRLIDMKKSGASWPKIGQALNRSGSSVRARYSHLKNMGLIEVENINTVTVIDEAADIAEETKLDKPVELDIRLPKEQTRNGIKYRTGKASYSKEDENRIIEMYNSGESDEQIGQALGRSRAAIMNQIVKLRRTGRLGKRPAAKDGRGRGRYERGQSKPKKTGGQKSNVSFTQDEDRQIRKLHKDGESPAQIAKLIGRDAIEVMAQLNNLGLE